MQTLKASTLMMIALSLATNLILSGCSNESPQQSLMQDYVGKVANVLNEDYQWQQQKPVPALPPQRLRLQPTTLINEGLIDVLDLAKCNLLPLIASRNSSLGKLARSSQRLVYEIQFFKQISLCLPLIDKDLSIEAEVKERIYYIYKVKKNNLPYIFWNALYTGQEIDASLAINQTALPLSQPDKTSTLSALSSLSSMTVSTLQNNISPDAPSLENIEEYYAAIYHQPLGTALLKSLLLLEATMNNVTHLINSRLARRPMCFSSMPNPKANILKTVFIEYYAGQIQPYMAYVHRIGEQWFSLHSKTLELLPIPKEVAPYAEQVFIQNSKTSFWGRYITARDNHTQAWQRVLRQCNLMPSSPN